MKIPEKIKIGGHEYTCRIVPAIGRDYGANGRSCGNSLEIEIEETLSQQNKESTLIHEILEQINYRYELGLEHQKITILETALYQVICDNPDMFINDGNMRRFSMDKKEVNFYDGY